MNFPRTSLGTDGNASLFVCDLSSARLRAWTTLPKPRELQSDLPLETLAATLVASLEQRHSIQVTATLDAQTEDIARRILGNRLQSVEHTGDPRTVQITVGYDQLDAVRQLMQFTDHIEIISPPEARQLIATLANKIAHRHST